MKLVGRWHNCHDGLVRPLVLAELPAPSGGWHQVLFLVDTGADGIRLTLATASRLGIADGRETDIRFDDARKPLTVRKILGVESQFSPFEYSTLGRDILDGLTVVLDRSRNVVALLTSDHGYTIADA